MPRRINLVFSDAYLENQKIARYLWISSNTTVVRRAKTALDLSFRGQRHQAQVNNFQEMCFLISRGRPNYNCSTNVVSVNIFCNTPLLQLVDMHRMNNNYKNAVCIMPNQLSLFD